MLYMPVSTQAMPLVTPETNTAPLQSSSRYYLMQSAPVLPAVPVCNTTYIFPRYGYIPRPVETSVTKEDIEKNQETAPVEVMSTVQHVIHHHVQPYGYQTCPGYCNLCCPWIDQPRYSRRDQFEHDQRNSEERTREESLDERIQRIRDELGERPTIDTVVHHIHHTTERPSTSFSQTRERWRSTNQNEYPWRDTHLPAYREAAATRLETAHERSHRNNRTKASDYYSKRDFVYQPKSEVEARKWYKQTTGKDPDHEVYQALHGEKKNNDHRSHSTEASHSTQVHRLTKIDSTQHHDLYTSNNSTVHVVPKQGGNLDAPYVRILNAPVTYLH